MQLRDLYQSIIVDNALRPQHQDPISGKDVKEITVFNPTCGDQLKLSGKFDHQNLKQISFRAKGCIISRASTNMMSNLCLNQTVTHIVSLVTEFSKLMTNEKISNPQSLGEARALQSVSQLPTRIKCGMLPWKAIYQLIYQTR